MASILVNIEKGVEVAAEDVLHWLGGAAKTITLAPKVLAAIAILLGAIGKAVTDGTAAAAQDGINLPLDLQTWNDIKAVWPDVKTVAEDLGIKL